MVESLITFLSYFVMCFSTLSFIRLGGKFISSLLSNPPKQMILTNSELIYHGLTLSYIITFTILVALL